VDQKFEWLTPEQREAIERRGLEQRSPPDFVDASVELFELSGTGLEGPLLRAMLDYMRFVRDGRQRSLADHPPELQAQMALCAELAARAGLVEYGTALRHAWWTTPKGALWFENAEEWLRAQQTVTKGDL